MADGVILTEAGYRKLKRDLEQLRLGFKNLSRKIRHQSVRNGARPMALRVLIGKTNASHSKGASGTVNIWGGTAGSETSIGKSITAYNRFGNIGSGKWVIVVSFKRNKYIIAAECP